MDKIYTALGLMSGTSMDGVDASIIESDGDREYTPKLDRYFEYGLELRQKLVNIRAKILNEEHLKVHFKEINDLEREITLFHANIVNEIITNYETEIDFLGFHGHTIFHDSKKKISKQIGDGKLLSQLTKKKVIYDFRQNDLKNGGQGAPLVPIFHNAMVNKYLNKELNKSYSIDVLNIGGIANITQTVKWEDFSSPSNLKTIKACDISPGNCLIDEWVRKNSKNRYDEDGSLASVGESDDLILNQALENFDIDTAYKESLDVNDFNISFAKGLSLENGASTITDFTASLIVKALIHLYSEPIQGKIFLVCGGGRKNRYLIKSIINQLGGFKKIVLHLSEKYSIDGDFVESQAFAYLAIRSFLKLPISFPSTTRCKQPTSGGVMVQNF